jgi:hypothetical protein
MSSTPEAGNGDAGKRDRRRWIIIGIVVAIVAIVIATAVGAYLVYDYLYGGIAPDAPTIDNALQQLLPTAPPE